MEDAVSKYVRLIERFTSGAIDARTFETKYLDMFKSESLRCLTLCSTYSIGCSPMLMLTAPTRIFEAIRTWMTRRYGTNRCTPYVS